MYFIILEPSTAKYCAQECRPVEVPIHPTVNYSVPVAEVTDFGRRCSTDSCRVFVVSERQVYQCSVELKIITKIINS
jgi:hypothetical protein